VSVRRFIKSRLQPLPYAKFPLPLNHGNSALYSSKQTKLKPMFIQMLHYFIQATTILCKDMQIEQTNITERKQHFVAFANLSHSNYKANYLWSQ